MRTNRTKEHWFDAKYEPNRWSHSSDHSTDSSGPRKTTRSLPTDTGLLNALTGQTPSVAKQTPSQSPQTFVIPNHSTTVSSATSGVVVTNAVIPGTNIILSRPHSFGHLINQHQLCRLVSSSIRYKHRTAPYWYRYRYSHTSYNNLKCPVLRLTLN